MIYLPSVDIYRGILKEDIMTGITIGERLREARLAKNKTVKEMAALLHITARAYRNYEYDAREPNLHILKQICIYLNVSADYLIGIDMYKQRNGL
jgi:transcriptional regulator with XRE-family HTH domain